MIPYTTVARGQTIIASYSRDGTDLSREVQKLLEQPYVVNEQRRMNRYIFTFCKKNNLTFICASPAESPTSYAVQYLDRLSDCWCLTLLDASKTATQNSLSNSTKDIFDAVYKDVIENEPSSEKIKREMEQTQRLMTESVQLAMSRGNDLENLSTKTEDLLSTSADFRNNAVNLKNKMLCARYKAYALYTAIVFIILYYILAKICGGYSLKPRCRK
ncbi:Synaptobrevin family protein [Trichomonas vaginalis G3]|uniref:Synaptobrevin family protein n=1 Tax=Trichomonas vaginalis (strain ATCC PRA-98 / G3) TaxID=412133 RepID=A2FYP9_TRIV3|nr:SNAP receptor protein [Trichomonas vaginalis G3]EAX89971.1 Synaptobrevin family protein [Trichomonas vaginalis G3]KAI5547841.1 SNAP receptor protein [Trichomonas vaginalis G3]|eukprot:XP_001302901.1 Synaptobrevin family protein [Trichomonas vaginalis G3]